MTARERMLAGELYDASDPELVVGRERARGRDGGARPEGPRRQELRASLQRSDVGLDH